MTIKTGRWRGVLRHFPIRKGACHGWSGVEYRSDGIVKTNVIGRWKKGLPKDKDQPWFLITSLPVRCRQTALRLSDLCALRFDIEELPPGVRDTKNEHLGWSLSKTRIKKADRLDRLMLIAAIAYVLLAALGLCAGRTGRRGCGRATIGRRSSARWRSAGRCWIACG